MNPLDQEVQDAIEMLDDWLKEHQGEDPAGELDELADEARQVYTSDAIRMALDNLWLATEVPESSSEGVSALSLINDNICEYVRDKLWKHARKREDEFYCEGCDSWLDTTEEDLEHAHPDYSYLCVECADEFRVEA